MLNRCWWPEFLLSSFWKEPSYSLSRFFKINRWMHEINWSKFWGKNFINVWAWPNQACERCNWRSKEWLGTGPGISQKTADELGPGHKQQRDVFIWKLPVKRLAKCCATECQHSKQPLYFLLWWPACEESDCFFYIFLQSFWCLFSRVVSSSFDDFVATSHNLPL